MLIGIHPSIVGNLSLSPPPIHQCVNQRFWFLTCDVSERRNQLVKARVHSRATHVFNSKFRIGQAVDAVVDLLVCLTDKLSKTSVTYFSFRK